MSETDAYGATSEETSNSCMILAAFQGSPNLNEPARSEWRLLFGLIFVFRHIHVTCTRCFVVTQVSNFRHPITIMTHSDSGLIILILD